MGFRSEVRSSLGVQLGNAGLQGGNSLCEVCIVGASARCSAVIKCRQVLLLFHLAYRVVCLVHLANWTSPGVLKSQSLGEVNCEKVAILRSRKN